MSYDIVIARNCHCTTLSLHDTNKWHEVEIVEKNLNDAFQHIWIKRNQVVDWKVSLADILFNKKSVSFIDLNDIIVSGI